MRYRITAPVEGFTGTVAGVALVNGEGETSDEGAVAYFRRQGYTVTPAPARRQRRKDSSDGD